jgi:transcriptional regulator with XRE-family HTH domain
MNEDLAKLISKEVHNARVKAGITQAELAKRINSRQPTIARLESGRYLPTMSFLKRIADAYEAKLLPPSFEFIEELNGKK